MWKHRESALMMLLTQWKRCDQPPVLIERVTLKYYVLAIVELLVAFQKSTRSLVDMHQEHHLNFCCIAARDKEAEHKLHHNFSCRAHPLKIAHYSAVKFRRLQNHAQRVNKKSQCWVFFSRVAGNDSTMHICSAWVQSLDTCLQRKLASGALMWISFDLADSQTLGRC